MSAELEARLVRSAKSPGCRRDRTTNRSTVRLLAVVLVTLSSEVADAGICGTACDHLLDPLRHAEESIAGEQAAVEERTKLHLSMGIAKSYLYDFNDPSSHLISLRLLDTDHDSPELDLFQLGVSRPSGGWLVPGFVLKLDVGRIAKHGKADWDGDGVLQRGDAFEKNSVEPQDAYLQWTVPDDAPRLRGLSFKGGKFVTLVGAEVTEPWLNYTVSHSLLLSLAQPGTHTGGLVSYPVNDRLLLTGGLVAGWDNVADNNHAPTGIGNATMVLNERLTLSAGGLYGPEQTNRTGPKRGLVDMVATVHASPQVTLVLNYDWAHEEAALGAASAMWQGLSTVANYAFTERLSATLRGEWFDDPDGVRTGLRQTVWEGTVTGTYLLTPHLRTRAEYRHDESSKRHVFAAGDRKLLRGQDVLGFEVSYVFN